MGKQGSGSRQRSRDRRAKERRARKEANRAQYAAWRDAGKNQKKKRNSNNVKFSATKHTHQVMNCGNPGCSQCGPILLIAWRVKMSRHPVEVIQTL